MLKQEFAENLRKIRKSRKLTQEKLAELVGVDFRYISFIENARSFPSCELIEKLAKALDVSYCEMFSAERNISENDLRTNITNLIKYLDSKQLKILYRLAEDLISE